MPPAILASIVEDNPIFRGARVILRKINTSASLILIVFGLLLILISALLQDGALPALLTIWGVGFILIGAVAYTLIWWIKR